jgi:hypothetical protein
MHFSHQRKNVAPQSQGLEIGGKRQASHAGEFMNREKKIPNGEILSL